MTVKVPKLSGFCPGVKAAEHRIFDELKEHPDENHSVLGMMINNRKYIAHLGAAGIKTVEEESCLEKGSTVFIRTHGINRNLQKELSGNFKLIDLTCRNVKRVQTIIGEHSTGGAAIFITGKKSHPEVVGLQSYGENTLVIETPEDLESFIASPVLNGRKFRPEDYTEIFITSQTTGNRRIFSETIIRFREKWPEASIESFNSICPVTERKENEALELQKETDISFVLGDPLSSNAGKLYKILKTADEHTLFIQDVKELKELNLDFNGISSALVVSSASTPDFVEREVIDFLEGIN